MDLIDVYTGWWFGTWILRLSRYWEIHSPNGRTPLFFRGVGQPPTSIYIYTFIYIYTWWLIPLSKWVIALVINGISRVNPLIIGVITHLRFVGWATKYIYEYQTQLQMNCFLLIPSREIRRIWRTRWQFWIAVRRGSAPVVVRRICFGKWGRSVNKPRPCACRRRLPTWWATWARNEGLDKDSYPGEDRIWTCHKCQESWSSCVVINLQFSATR